MSEFLPLNRNAMIHWRQNVYVSSIKQEGMSIKYRLKVLQLSFETGNVITKTYSWKEKKESSQWYMEELCTLSSESERERQNRLAILLVNETLTPFGIYKQAKESCNWNKRENI